MDPAPSTPLPVAPASEPPALPIVWPRSAQLATAFLLGVASTLLALHAMQSLRWGARPSEGETRLGITYRIDLNRAGLAELVQIPGLGPVLAERIETYRRLHGPFTSVDQLLDVPGIGPTMLERFRPWLRVDVVAESEPFSARRSLYPADVDAPTAPSQPPARKETALTAPIDINRADAAELQRLPGIGPVLAQRILDERNHRPFQTVDELIRVAGIGPKTLEKIRPYVMVGATPTAPLSAQ